MPDIGSASLALGSVATIAAIVAFIRQGTGLPRRAAPLAAVVVGIAIHLAIQVAAGEGVAGVVAGALEGLQAGLAAAGGVKAAKMVTGSDTAAKMTAAIRDGAAAAAVVLSAKPKLTPPEVADVIETEIRRQGAGG